MTSMPRAVIFDLDGTLLDTDGTADEGWRQVCDELGPPVGVDEARLLETILSQRDMFWEDETQWRPWRLDIIGARMQFLARAFAMLGADDPEAPHRFATLFTKRRFSNNRLFPRALETLETLGNSGVALALLTNGDGPEQRAKIRHFDLARHFTHVNVEGESGIGKPDERVYLEALRALGSDAQQTWMVGDHIEYDVLAPQRLGICGIWIDRSGLGIPKGAIPSRVISAVHEII